jgi:seryl-tRNA synthetase
LEVERDRLNIEIVAAEEKEKDLKTALERAEIREKKVSKYGEKIAERAREKINEYKTALTALRDEIAYHTDRIAALESILENLTNDHNKNYHDMAVKTAVSGWDELKGQEVPDFGVTEEQLNLLEKEDVDLGDDDADFSNEFDETVSLRIPPPSFIYSVPISYSLSNSGLFASTSYRICHGPNRIYSISPCGAWILTKYRAQ